MVFQGEQAALVHMQNIVDLRLHDNQELAIRFNTNVKNGRVFYTDLNGFDMRCVPSGAI